MAKKIILLLLIGLMVLPFVNAYEYNASIYHLDLNAYDTCRGNNGANTNGLWSSNGHFNQSIYFGGTNQYITIPYNSFFSPNYTLTITAWVKPTNRSITYGYTVFDRQLNYWLVLSPNGTITFYKWNSATPADFLFYYSTEPVEINNWTFISVTFNYYDTNQEIRFYKNGVENGTRQANGGIYQGGSYTQYIGQRLGSFFFVGYIDELAFYNKTLTPTEINNIYRANRTQECNELINITPALNILSCHYDTKPIYNLVQNKINWICETNTNTACLSYIKEDNGNITDVFPDVEYKDYYGEINSFNCPKICNIEFKTRNIINNYNYTFGVRCENLDFNVTITPKYYLMQNQIVNRLIWTKENIPYLIILFIILALLLALLIWLFKKIMQELRFW